MLITAYCYTDSEQQKCLRYVLTACVLMRYVLTACVLMRYVLTACVLMRYVLTALCLGLNVLTALCPYGQNSFKVRGLCLSEGL